MTEIPTITANELNERHSDFHLVDVRSQDEFRGELSHIDGAQLATLGDELTHYLSDFNQKKPIVFICSSGVRSASATTQAIEMGLEAYNLVGGMIDWNQKKLPVVSQK